MNTPSLIVDLDSRRRAPLAKLNPRHTRYLATIAPDGTITLTPAVLVPASEANKFITKRQRPQKGTR